MEKLEVIIIGSGIAALQTAIEASKSKHVTLITKSKLRDSNSYLAQGGIAVAMSEQDNPTFHQKDTIQAGRRYNNAQAVQTLVEQAPQVISNLIDSRMRFDHDQNGNLVFGMEGAHSERRILHSHGDATGKDVTDHLLSKLDSSNIDVVEDTAVVELILGEDHSCIGVKVINQEGKWKPFTGSILYWQRVAVVRYFS